MIRDYRRRFWQRMLLVSCAAAALSVPIQAGAAEEESGGELHRAFDSIVMDEQGRAYVPDGDGRRSGRFAIAPDFVMGDVNRDNSITAEDAADLLICAADAGALGSRAEELVFSSHPEQYADVQTALLFADAGEDGQISADDAAVILIYLAQKGAGTADAPLGSHEFWADADGYLQSGFFTDPDSGVTYYADDTFSLRQGWLELEGKCYYLDESGALSPEGWLTVNAAQYYVTADGSILCDAWVTDADRRFYLDGQGIAVTGMTEIAGQVYCFDENGLVSGWYEQGGARYYCDADGIPMTGRQVIGEASYYFDPETAQMTTGLLQIGESYYYYLEDGVMQTGWVEADGVRAYFHEDGVRASGLTEIGEDSYFFDENGAVCTGWVTIGKAQHYFGEDGTMYKLWHEIDGNQYCFGGGDGVMLTGWADIGGNKYYFGTDGIMVTNAMVGDWYLTEDGTAISQTLHVNRERAQAAFASSGTSVDEIYNYVRSTTRYKKIEATKTLAQIESNGWLYYVDYSMTHYYGVCYYLAAKMDFLLREAGYECRIVHSTHGSGDHYWNQICIDGTWINYDCTNGLRSKTWEQMVAFGSYRFLGYVTPDYQ